MKIGLPKTPRKKPDVFKEHNRMKRKYTNSRVLINIVGNKRSKETKLNNSKMQNRDNNFNCNILKTRRIITNNPSKQTQPEHTIKSLFNYNFSVNNTKEQSSEPCVVRFSNVLLTPSTPASTKVAPQKSNQNFQVSSQQHNGGLELNMYQSLPQFRCQKSNESMFEDDDVVCLNTIAPDNSVVSVASEDAPYITLNNSDEPIDLDKSIIMLDTSNDTPDLSKFEIVVTNTSFNKMEQADILDESVICIDSENTPMNWVNNSNTQKQDSSNVITIEDDNSDCSFVQLNRRRLNLWKDKRREHAIKKSYAENTRYLTKIPTNCNKKLRTTSRITHKIHKANLNTETVPSNYSKKLLTTSEITRQVPEAKINTETITSNYNKKLLLTSEITHEVRAANINTDTTKSMLSEPSINVHGITEHNADTTGSNMYNSTQISKSGLREIIIDGSNVALGHTNGVSYSVEGLQIVINYFLKRGHKVRAFVPKFRINPGRSTNTGLLRQLVTDKHVILTPSRAVLGRRITPYDDRFIIQYATACEGIVVSSDCYRDLINEKPEWRSTIENRILMPTWIDDILMFPEDPMGRFGPNLTDFLKFPSS